MKKINMKSLIITSIVYLLPIQLESFDIWWTFIDFIWYNYKSYNIKGGNNYGSKNSRRHVTSSSL